jgi:hypothetical protein
MVQENFSPTRCLFGREEGLLIGTACAMRYDYKTHDECMRDVSTRMAEDVKGAADRIKCDMTPESFCTKYR